MKENNNVFSEIQEKYSIVNVVKDLGITLHRVGNSLRANSIAGNGEGKDAFAVYERTNSWYDFMLGIGGDITDLVAYVKYNGDKHNRALQVLMIIKKVKDFCSPQSSPQKILRGAFLPPAFFCTCKISYASIKSFL